MVTSAALSLFHYSANTWAGISVVIALASLLATVVQLRSSSSRRVLTYSLLSDTQLVSPSARQKAGPDLRVVLRGASLEDPHVVSIKILYRGRHDIRIEDFQGAAPVVFDLGAIVLAKLNEDGDFSSPEIVLGSTRTTIDVGPCLIKDKQVFSIDLLTDGPIEMSPPMSSLADVSIRKAQADDDTELSWMRRAQVAAFTLFGIGIFYYLMADPDTVPFSFVEFSFALGFVGFILWIARAIVTSRRRRGQLIT